MPFKAQITTVSQNVPDDETNAWRTGLRVCAAAATIGAEPIPDSLENKPLAIPKRAAVITVAPTNPPPAAVGVKADTHISFNAGRYTQEEVWTKRHNYELEKSDCTVFCVDWAMAGVGSNSCGPSLATKYRIQLPQVKGKINVTFEIK